MRATYLGHHDPASMLNITVALKLRNTEQLHEFLQAVQDPASSKYHQFLTPDQFNSMYGPTQAQAAAVVAYLKAHGLTVADVTADNRLIHVQAQSGKVEQVFHVLINDYVYHGRSVFGTMDAPQLPNDIASTIVAVRGLSNILRLRPMVIKAANVQPLSSGGPVGYSPQQIATAYNYPPITDTVNGSGVTIAIAAFDSSGLSANDYDSFWSYYGLPSHTVQIISVDNPSTGFEGEATLDVERSGAMAPGAAIEVYDGECQFTIPNPCSFDDVYDAIVSANNAQVMTTSFGAPIDDWSTGDLQDGDQWFEQMAAQGIAVFAADGDGGSSDCRSTQCTPTANMADYPSADPYVVAAGGTSLTLNGNNTIASETAWSYSCSGTTCVGTGGAISNYVINGVTYWPEPSWQTGNGVPQNGYRNTSDLSMNADPNTGYSLYFDGAWENVPTGGTSFVAPQLAGLFADQISLSGGTRLGQANEAIYIDANSYYTSDFHDITSGSNGAFSAGPGWDHPTGWGSPNAAELLTHIAGGTAISEPQNLDAEYLGCRLSLDKYFITWQAPQIGTPSGGYDAEYEYVGQTDWQSFHYGPGPQANINLPPSTAVGIRVRASNGSIWSAYNTDMFTTSACSPPP
jgi:kumamolisin